MTNIDNLKKIKYLSSLLLGTVLLFGIFYFFYDITHSNKKTRIDNPKKPSNICREEDGDHRATATYYNPETGYKTTYKVKVSVKDCRIFFIDFERGWFDDKQTVSAKLDSDQNATVADEEGNRYEVHIDD